MAAGFRRPATRLLALLLALLLLDLLVHLSVQLPHTPFSTRPAASGGAKPADAIVSAAREIAGRHDNVLMVAFVQREHWHECVNFLATLRKSGLLPTLLAIALDQPSVDLLQKQGDVIVCGLPSLTANHNVTRDALAARTASMQWELLSSLARAGLRVWRCDVRVLWMRGSLQEASRRAASSATVCDLHFVTSSIRAPSAALSFYNGNVAVALWQERVAALTRESRLGAAAEARFLSQTMAGDKSAVCSNTSGAGDRACIAPCRLPARVFPNGVQAFQQPGEDAATEPHAPRPLAILADTGQGARHEYMLRENGMWQSGADADARGRSGGGERFIAFKELIINNGLSNARNALRSALALATITNRTLILPPYWSRHLRGEPYRVGVDYYFDYAKLTRLFPRVRESSYLVSAFPDAQTWPPKPSLPVFMVKLSDDEGMCKEVTDASQLEALGNVNTTCPPLSLPSGQLIAMRAKHYHLGADEGELREWLRPHAHRPLLYFARMFRRFGHFDKKDADAAFSKRYAEAVQPAPEIREVAARALKAVREATKVEAAAQEGSAGKSVADAPLFDCVHMRRRDFVADHAEEESVAAYAARAAKKLRRQGKGKASARQRRHLPIYLASDVAEEAATQAAFRKHFPLVLTLQQVFPRSDLDSFTSAANLSRLIGQDRAVAMGREMRMGNVDQLICSAADRFVGNLWSSFTHHVCYLREQRGVKAACRGKAADIYDREVDKKMQFV